MENLASESWFAVEKQETESLQIKPVSQQSRLLEAI
jgi:hypothetical protein